MTPDDILTDFRRKYEGTFVFVTMPDSDEDNLFYMEKIISSKTCTGVMALKSEEFGKILLNLGTAHTIKFKFPRVGMFQHGSHSMLFLRSARRQYQRGLSGGNCSIVNVISRICPTLHEELSFELVQAAFKGSTYQAAEAVKMLQSGKYHSVALSNNFSLVLSPTKEKDYLMMHWQSPIARVSAELQVTHIIEPVYASQIKQVLTQ